MERLAQGPTENLVEPGTEILIEEAGGVKDVDLFQTGDHVLVIGCFRQLADEASPRGQASRLADARTEEQDEVALPGQFAQPPGLAHEERPENR
jgi:hypothetical protein